MFPVAELLITPSSRISKSTRLLTWSNVPKVAITTVRTWMTLVNRVDKPHRLTRGARVRCSRQPVTRKEPAVERRWSLSLVRDLMHPDHVRGLGKRQTSLQ